MGVREFCHTDLGASQMSAEELDDLALNNGGVVGTLGGTYDVRKNVSQRHGYAFQWIGTRGGGNMGTLILKGTTPYTRQLLLEGRIKDLCKRFGVSKEEAKVITEVRAAYSHEDRVIRAAVETAGCDAWEDYPGEGNGASRWVQVSPLRDSLEGMSIPRVGAVYVIVKALRTGGSNRSFGGGHATTINTPRLVWARQ